MATSINDAVKSVQAWYASGAPLMLALSKALSPQPPAEAVKAGFVVALPSMSNEFDDPATVDFTGNVPPTGAIGSVNLWNSGGFSGNPSQFSIANSILTIASTGDQVGMVTGVNNQNKGTAVQYGCIEFMVRFKPLDNNHPALWMFCLEHNLGTDNGDGAEFDIAEFGGGSFVPNSWRSLTYLNDCHLTSLGAPTVAGARPSTIGLNAEDWHRYSLVWLPGVVSFYRDGAQTFSFNYSESQPYWDGKAMHEFLSMGWDRPWDGTTPGLATIDIDWVRTWISPSVSHVINNF